MLSRRCLVRQLRWMQRAEKEELSKPLAGKEDPKKLKLETMSPLEKEQVELERVWMMESAVEEVKTPNVVDVELLYDNYKQRFLEHITTVLKVDPALEKLMKPQLKSMLTGTTMTQRQLDNEKLFLEELASASSAALGYDEEENEATLLRASFTEDHILMSLDANALAMVVNTVLRCVSNGVLVGKAAANRMKRASVVTDQTRRELFSVYLPKGSTDPANRERTLAVLYKTVLSLPDAVSEELFLKSIDGSMRNFALGTEGSKHVRRFLIHLCEDEEGVMAKLEAIRKKRGIAFTMPLCGALAAGQGLKKYINNAEAWVKDISDKECRKLISEIPEGLEAAFDNALLNRVHAQDQYASLATVLQRITAICINAENSNSEISQGKRSFSKTVQPRHFHAAGSLVDLLLETPYKGSLPFIVSSVSISTKQRTLNLTSIRADACLKNAVSVQNHFISDYPPMLCPPESWATIHEYEGSAMRSPFKTMAAKMLRAPSSGASIMKRLDGVLAPAMAEQKVTQSLDYIGQVRWRLNENAIEHIQYVKAKGFDLGDKLRGGWIPLPPPPPKYITEKSLAMTEMLKEEQNVKISQRSGAQASAGSITELMHQFRGKDLWLPSNCDFRGRTYPLHSGLNYQASDFIRSLLEFGDEKPLGKNGLWHLKVHTANLMGLDKASFNDRVQWCDDHVEEIIENAENSKAENALWRSADKPLLGHVVLCELAGALKCSMGPEHYVTRIPIHVDGSCNGLQHYSAIALDDKGAFTANLTRKSHADKPSDVYTTVLEQVKVYNQSNMTGENSAMAMFVHPLLKRKTVKQSVMTNVYGVTSRGMRDQVLGQLVAQTEDMIPRPPPTYLAQTAGYVVKLIEKSLEDVFQGAIQVQKWFGEVITVLNEAHRNTGIISPPISFMSPAGVPVMQPYFEESPLACTVNVGNLTTTIEYKQRDYRLSYRKNKTAFPPNFIHSMDASHVHLTTCKLKQAGIMQFGSVHDSYWGHACDMDDLNHILRQAFVEMYSVNRLEMLYADLQSSHGKCLRMACLTLPLPPKQGNFDVSEVLDSPYFFA